MSAAEDQFQSQILSRLDEHGEEIRALRNLIERLVRIEERQQAHSDTFSRFGRRIERLEEKVEQIESAQSCYTTSLRWLERLLWALCSGGAWMISEWVHLNV
jgi:hypothetical protein